MAGGSHCIGAGPLQWIGEFSVKTVSPPGTRLKGHRPATDEYALPISAKMR